MSKYIVVLAMIVLPCCARFAAAAEEPRLTAQAGRITDQAISADISAINNLQKRLADINTQGIMIGAYHFAKAQAWIDMAMDEYSMNDRTTVIEDTVRQAHELISRLESRQGTIPMDTPILPTSKMIRPDLWLKAENWKKHPGFSCGEDLVAQLEVQLVWAGHEDNQLGWRHAKPYLQAAERLAKEAGRKIESCPSQLAAAEKTVIATGAVEADENVQACADTQVKCPTCPACPSQLFVAPERGTSSVSVTPAIPVIAPVSPANAPATETVSDRIHFALNRDIISPRSAAVLQRIAAVLQAHPDVTVELQGNADERGNQTFNKVLSRQRAEVVRTYLVSAGISRGRMTVKAFGETQPLMQGHDIVSFARNRRVEFVFRGDVIKIVPQFEDVQLERVKR